jgi:two-component system CheB/CheR fusion protein
MNRTPPGALRVLVVDDNADARKSLCWLLTLLGHTTQQADSGKAALETAARSLPDVVLLDIGLPGMDGFEVARQLRLMPGAEGVLLAAVTGHCDPEDIDHGREAGFDVHLPKPMDLSMLEQLLRNHELTKR